MYKLTFLAGAALGFVLGSRAGRASYDDLKRQADSLWHDPRVQEKVAAAGQTVKDKAPEVGAKLAETAGHAASAAKDTATHAAAAAKDKVTGNNADDDMLIGSEKTSDYTPKETKVQSDSDAPPVS